MSPLGMLKKIQNGLSHTTTYRIGLLQSKAYRILQQRTTKSLAGRGIGPLHWALLGLVYDLEGGVRSTDAARELGVEAPFVTVLISDLTEKGYTESVVNPNDARSKLIRITKAGKDFVDETEPWLRKEMNPLLRDVPVDDTLSYLSVLQSIVDNSESS